jgi:hypothetical protein
MAATLGNGTITFGDGTSQSTAGSMLGVGQTWTNVTIGRSNNTNYLNTSGKPIMVMVSSGGNQGTHIDVYINDIVISNGTQLPVNGAGATVSFIVPNSATYRVFISNNIQLWYELR